MTHSDLHYLDAGAIAHLICTREISPVELTRTILDRIDRLDASLHSYAHVMRHQALEQAAAAEQRVLAGEPLGPLHGVPIAIKDLYWAEGAPTARVSPPPSCASCGPAWVWAVPLRSAA